MRNFPLQKLKIIGQGHKRQIIGKRLMECKIKPINIRVQPFLFCPTCKLQEHLLADLNPHY